MIVPHIVVYHINIHHNETLLWNTMIQLSCIRMCGKYDPGHTALRDGVSIPAWLYTAWAHLLALFQL